MFFVEHSTFAHQTAKEVTVYMENLESYKPRDLNINKGDMVIFVNTDKNDHWPASNIHPTHGIYSEFDPKKPIPTGQNWKFTFDKEGIWQYHDHLYPNIKGKITVTNENNNEKEEETITSKTIDEKTDQKPSVSLWQKLLDKIGSIFDKLVSFSKKIVSIFKPNPVSVKDALKHIDKNSPEIFNNNEALKTYAQNHGAKETLTYLNQISLQYGSCHDTAHRLGRITYELYGDKAFKECGAECHSGCYHGATEAYFREHGTANLANNLKTLCSSDLNYFFSHQCIHGVGHGLTAWSNYEINDALKICDTLPQRQDSCWTGVFMENIVGGLSDQGDGHFTKYLSDDPQYPCNIVEEKYKSSCYFLQTSRMIQLFKGDFKKVSDACLKAPKAYQNSCFSSMGRDVGGSNKRNPEGLISNCSVVPKGQFRTDCIVGAVQDYFWDHSGQDDAINFCKLLIDKDEKNDCYKTIFQRATEIFTTKSDLKNFCAKAEIPYQSSCLIIISKS